MTAIPFVLACLAAASTGAIFRPGAWYERLRKPAWRPPNRLFPPAWGVLYVCIALAGWLAWRAAGFGPALAAWCVQLALNAGWSAVFFGLRRPGWALAELALLWLAIGATVALFAPLSTAATLLMLPYWAWVSFAGALNLSIWRANGGRPA